MAYTTENGCVQVSQSAIADLIHSVCGKDPQLSHLKLRIRTQQKKLKLQIRLRIESGSHLKSIEEGLQQDLRVALRDSLGIDQVGSIDIVATGIKAVKPPIQSASKNTLTIED